MAAKPGGKVMPAEKQPEYLIEFIAMGNSVKVSALDPVTGMEVSIVGPASAGRHILTTNAVRKLERQIAKAKMS